MKMIRFQIKPLGSFMTDWSSDTLVGSLFWAYVRREGETALAKLINSFKAGWPPFVLSSGFPGDLLPRPYLPVQGDRKSIPTVQDMQSAKRMKRVKWITLAAFNQVIQGEPLEVDEIEEPFLRGVVLHNQVGRLTGTTADGGELYSADETFLNEKCYHYLSVYAYVLPEWEKTLLTLFTDAGYNGIGGRSSTGKGAFVVQNMQPFDGFVPAEAPNGFILLGNVVPRIDDPVTGYYRTSVKRGRLGEERSRSSNPFKKPLIMLAPGSTFYGDPTRQFIGRIVEGISLSAPDVVQCGIAMVAPARLPGNGQIS